jgi:hypothetical protein
MGYYGGYFFDETPLRVQNPILKWRFPTMTYSFRLNKKFEVGVLRGIHDYRYIRYLINGNPPPNTIYGRIIRHYSIFGGVRSSISRIVIKYSIGASYRTGFRAKHLYTYDRGSWIEGYKEYKDYKDFGVSVGLSCRHPIVHRFFGELSLNYIRYFSDFDQNLFMPGYRLGFRF